MHREVERLLASAEGTPVRALVVFVDVRGFSDFCRRHEVDEVAQFVKRFYRWTLDRIGSGCRLWRSTGDGMLLVFTYDSDDAERRMTLDIVNRALAACAEFGKEMSAGTKVPLDTPRGVGFGVARGSSLCILRTSDREIDVCGVVVNRAARLLDQARPSGVVVDAAVYRCLQETELAGQFVVDRLYLDGVSGTEPTLIAAQATAVVIDPAARVPRDFEWALAHRFEYTKFRDLHKLQTVIGCHLPGPLPQPTDFEVVARFPARARSGELLPDFYTERIFTTHARYELLHGRASLTVPVDVVVRELRERSVHDDDALTLEFWCLRRRSAPPSSTTG